MRAEDPDELLAIFADPRVMASFGVGLFDRTQMERWVRRNLERSPLDEAALDKYSFIRDAWVQRRRNVIYDGSPPRPKEEE